MISEYRAELAKGFTMDDSAQSKKRGAGCVSIE